MMRKVRVEEAGDSELLSGSTIDIVEFLDAEASVQARIDAGEKNEMGEDLRLPTCTRLLMGITKASLATESFLSAASFQETTKVLTEAAIKGKVDHLLGLKENVIIGKLIPAGSGLTQYRKFDTFDEEGNLTSQKSGGIVADALEADGEDEIAEETDLVELEETGVLELESPASEEEQVPTL
jgi:DNA-directed RNA polymerase subunit beta'